MSHYTRIKTRFCNKEALVKALNDVGYLNVEVYDKARNLVGYQGDLRGDVAEIIVRRQHVGSASNDLGFRLGIDGSYEAIISEYDQGKHNAAWMDELSQRYSYHATLDQLGMDGFELTDEMLEEDGGITLTLRRLA